MFNRKKTIFSNNYVLIFQNSAYKFEISTLFIRRDLKKGSENRGIWKNEVRKIRGKLKEFLKEKTRVEGNNLKNRGISIIRCSKFNCSFVLSRLCVRVQYCCIAFISINRTSLNGRWINCKYIIPTNSSMCVITIFRLYNMEKSCCMLSLYGH